MDWQPEPAGQPLEFDSLESFDKYVRSSSLKNPIETDFIYGNEDNFKMFLSDKKYLVPNSALNNTDYYLQIELYDFGRVNFHYFDKETELYIGSVNYYTYDINSFEGIRKSAKSNSEDFKFTREYEEKTIGGRRYFLEDSKVSAYRFDNNMLFSTTKPISIIYETVNGIEQGRVIEIDDFLKDEIIFKEINLNG